VSTTEDADGRQREERRAGEHGQVRHDWQQEEVKMGKIVAAEYLTLDGVTEDPGPAGDFENRGWTIPYWNDELAEYQSELLFSSDALLLGRITYEEFVASWPSRSGDPYTDRMNGMPKFVASTTLAEPLEWNATLLKGDLADDVTKLKQTDRSLLIYGSGELVKTLMQRHLVDVYRLMLYPLALARGKRFFREGGESTTLTLIDVKATSAGVVVLTYEETARG
jgi:dihydrofolate reductase